MIDGGDLARLVKVGSRWPSGCPRWFLSKYTLSERTGVRPIGRCQITLTEPT